VLTEIREHPPSTLKNFNDGPLGGAGAGDPRASTINVKKMSMVVTWEVPELEIQERPASTLKLSTTDP
jgi:hypothetical protein